ncbi:MAG TPA: hypothetical protein DHV96_08390 [Lachnospiraceae bacterium]|nr:hypothetical protein [Lachnospiraceae bacterium]
MDNSSIFDQLLYTTLRIECFDDNGIATSIGTGFLLDRPVGEDAYKMYLISNKHVLMKTDAIAITFNSGQNGEVVPQQVLRVPIKNLKGNVTGHPNPNVDVAALDCTGLFLAINDQLYYKKVSYNMLADFNEPELNSAESIYFVGYPENRFDYVNNLPLIRTGIIASNPKADFNGIPEFIIDAQVFPGSSGSPVFIDLTFEDIKNGHMVLGGQRKVKLLGIVAATMIRDNKLQVLETADDEKKGIKETIGLGIVFKAPLIKELIDSMPTD